MKLDYIIIIILHFCNKTLNLLHQSITFLYFFHHIPIQYEIYLKNFTTDFEHVIYNVNVKLSSF
jgi:hypothetical protein